MKIKVIDLLDEYPLFIGAFEYYVNKDSIASQTFAENILKHFDDLDINIQYFIRREMREIQKYALENRGCWKKVFLKCIEEDKKG